MLQHSFAVLRSFVLALLSLKGDVVIDKQDTRNPIEKIHLSAAEDHIHHHDNGIFINVNITEFTGKSAWVEVNWSGVRQPSFDDWIGVLAPADAKLRHSTPVKYKEAAVSPSYLTTGSGTTKFLLENHRTDLRIGFFLNGFDNPHLVAHTHVIKSKEINVPSHGRLALTGDNTEMLVQWTTATSTGGEVMYGEASGKYTHRADARDMTYTRHDMCGGAAKKHGWLDPGVFHYVLLTGLDPGKRYYYKFGAADTTYSEEFSFTAAPSVGPGTEVHIIALADMGQAEVDGSNEQSEMQPSLNTTRLMIEDALATDPQYSLVVHYGDISYARGHVTQWDRYHNQIEPLVARLPYMTAIGNHERDWPHSGDRFPHQKDSGGECGVPHERRFLMPTLAQDAPWFSYEYGPIHFIHYSTEHPFHKGSHQHDAILAALAAVDRTRTPWVIFAGHRPIYIDSTNESKYDGDQTVAAKLREAFEEALVEYHVDVTLHGHHHSYQRTCPAFDGECVGVGEDGVPNGPIHLVIGNAGAGLCTNTEHRQPSVFDKIHMWWGYTRIHATGARLTIDAVSDLDGEIFDSMTLEKPPRWGATWHEQNGGPPERPEKRPKLWWEADVIGNPPQVALHREQSRRLSETR